MTDVMRLKYRPLTAAEQEAMENIKTTASMLYDDIDMLDRLHGDSRELSLAKTKVEEAVMWATKYITQ
jgi:hypothetical protein